MYRCDYWNLGRRTAAVHFVLAIVIKKLFDVPQHLKVRCILSIGYRYHIDIMES